MTTTVARMRDRTGVAPLCQTDRPFQDRATTAGIRTQPAGIR
jgi:hypothetical protein